jgi:TRAP-type C4-dicarboxylate transport system permease small subunit
MDEERELMGGNAAVGIIIASIFFAIALVVQSGISGISVGIMKALAGDWLAIVASLIQLILGIILAIGAIYLALNILDRLTRRVDEFEEVKKGNVAVALMMAGVIVSTALIIQSGVIGITSALL